MTEAERMPPPEAQIPTSAGGRPGGTRPALYQRAWAGPGRSVSGPPPTVAASLAARSRPSSV